MQSEREVYIANPYLNILMVPKHWPLWGRKAFVLLSPVSVPLLVAAWALMLAAVFIWAICAAPVSWLLSLWRGTDAE